MALYTVSDDNDGDNDDNDVIVTVLIIIMHRNENPMYEFIFWELCSLSPNFHIHVSVSDLYIARIGPHI
jgi:hypothetical protein